MRNKRMAAAGLAVIMVIGGTWAYFNQKMTIKNPFSTGKYDSVIKEDFKPDDGDTWTPGATVNKDVEVKNTGDYDLFVRVKFDETWINKDNQEWKKDLTGLDGTTDQKNATDGLIETDGSVVQKIFHETNKNNWVYNVADGYWYYKANLTAGGTTGVFLDAVKLLEDTDMGAYTIKKYYTEAEAAPDESKAENFGANAADAGTKWVLYDETSADAADHTDKPVPESAKHNIVITRQDAEKPGYGNADYTLSITVQTVQATEDAMKTAFALTAAPSGCIWEFTEQN